MSYENSIFSLQKRTNYDTLKLETKGSKTKLEICFYCESNGHEPVRKWLKSLDKEIRGIIGKDICTVQEGWPLGMPLVGSLGNGLWEVRITVPNGIARIVFVTKANTMILLHGFTKKTQKIQSKDLNIARIRAKNLRELKC